MSTLVALAYLVSGVCFIMALRGLASKKLAFAYVIYRMCKAKNESSTGNEWTNNVTIVKNDYESTEIKVGVNETSGFTKNNCYIKALFSIDNEAILVKIQRCELSKSSVKIQRCEQQ